MNISRGMVEVYVIEIKSMTSIIENVFNEIINVVVKVELSEIR